MPPKLFGSDMNQGVRAVLLTAKALAVPVDLIDVNVYTEEHIEEELLKVSEFSKLLRLIKELGVFMLQLIGESTNTVFFNVAQIVEHQKSLIVTTHPY